MSDQRVLIEQSLVTAAYWYPLRAGWLEASGIAFQESVTSIDATEWPVTLLDSSKTVVEQAQAFNTGNLEEHEVNIRLNRLLFSKDLWMRPCRALSGGEKMRLTLCCFHLSQRAPDMIVLDEPTNNLDIRSAEILTSAINSYQGTVIAISHDEHFLQSINTQRTIQL